MFLKVLIAVAETAEQELTDEKRTALEKALRYFRDAAPKHTADEEVSLFPRLKRIDNPALRNALAHLDVLEGDHRWAEPLHARVEAIGSEYLRIGKLTMAQVTEFQQSLHQLGTMYKRHIAVEENEVFPLAARLLPAQQSEEIAREMSARRNVSTNRHP